MDFTGWHHLRQSQTPPQLIVFLLKLRNSLIIVGQLLLEQLDLSLEDSEISIGRGL